MISWLLVAVLLFADNAITTPTTSTQAEPALVSNATVVGARLELIAQRQPGDNRDAEARSNTNSGGGHVHEFMNGFELFQANGRNISSPIKGARQASTTSVERVLPTKEKHTFANNKSISTEQQFGPAPSRARTTGPGYPVSSLSGEEETHRDDDRGASDQLHHRRRASEQTIPKTNLPQQNSEQEEIVAADVAKTISAANDGASSKKADQPQQLSNSSKPTAATAAATTTTTTTTIIQNQQKKIYTNQFVIKVEGGEGEARRLAEKHGFIYLNHILGDYYHLEHRRLAKRSLDSFDMTDLDTSIQDEPHVSTVLLFFCSFACLRSFAISLSPPFPLPFAFDRPAR